MKQASKDERFEAAAKLRDSVDAVKAIFRKAVVVSTKEDIDQDVIAYSVMNAAPSSKLCTFGRGG